MITKNKTNNNGDDNTTNNTKNTNMPALAKQ